MIRTIHQTWKTAEIPEATYFPEWILSWRQHHPQWAFRFWTDDDIERLIRRCYPWASSFYGKVDKGVIRSDVGRALILHHCGGLYVDLDFVCLRPMDSLVAPRSGSVILGRHAQVRQPLPNAWMYSPPGHALWIYLIKLAAAAWRSGERHPEAVAGPVTLRRACAEFSVEVLPPQTLYPHTWGVSASRVKAEDLDWHDLSALRRAYPESYAVTRWAHGW